ncbi:MAG: hypothetical protein ACTHKF_04615, partial [Candidatus Nitrosocosmicus sp.]
DILMLRETEREARKIK